MQEYDERVKKFYDFMLERELIRQRRRAGLPKEAWTSDPIMQTFSFTNVKREHDRTTVELKRIYDAHVEAELDVKLLNCAMYRFFGTSYSASRLGWFDEWDRERYMKIAPDLSFTSAYIVTSAGRSEPKFLVVADFVESIWEHRHNIVAQASWETAISIMKICYGVGSFMAKEIYLDYILASGRIPSDWSTWTPVGPGGKRGAARVLYGINTQISEAEALKVIRDVYSVRDEFWPECFDGGEEDRQYTLPRLDLTDVQFQFCEFDKYSRVAEGRRPKRLFKPKFDAITGGAP